MSLPTPATASSYDAVPYESFPYSDTHPERLFTVATLFGLTPAPPARCRVLELGCGSGGNLLPMAEGLPDSEFVGIDLSARAAAEGAALVRDLGLPNVRILHAGISDVDAAYGTFDYVIAHGVFSWVPTEVQDKLLEVCGTRLSPNGVAFVSYNTYPGWHMRGMIRDMMRYHALRFPEPEKRIEQARALLDFLIQAAKVQEGSAYSVMLKSELETLRRVSDNYLYHDHLAEVNDPLYFHQFVERAGRQGLKYLGEAVVGLMVPGNLGPEVEKSLRMLGSDMLQTEQFMDFVRNRTFRQSLLVRESARPLYTITTAAVQGLHAASPGKPVADGPDDLSQMKPTGFRSPGGMVLTTDRPLLRAALAVLFEAWPGTVPLDRLLASARGRVEQAGGTPPPPPKDGEELASGLLNCVLGSNLVELHGMPLSFARTVSERPTARRSAAPRPRGCGPWPAPATRRWCWARWSGACCRCATAPARRTRSWTT